MEDGSGGVHLKNLSLLPANNEEDALNALFLGDTHRMIAETPMNMASTRSHCIFTVHLAARDAGSAVVRKAKLHLVDLAGSERVKKTNVGGTLLTEAKYINLSLHYLEQVSARVSASECGLVSPAGLCTYASGSACANRQGHPRDSPSALPVLLFRSLWPWGKNRGRTSPIAIQ